MWPQIQRNALIFTPNAVACVVTILQVSSRWNENCHENPHFKLIMFSFVHYRGCLMKVFSALNISKQKDTASFLKLSSISPCHLKQKPTFSEGGFVDTGHSVKNSTIWASGSRWMFTSIRPSLMILMPLTVFKWKFLSVSHHSLTRFCVRGNCLFLLVTMFGSMMSERAWRGVGDRTRKKYNSKP